MFEAWLVFVIGSFAGCGIGAAIWRAIHSTDRRRFQQRDWVAQHKRRINRNGFKARIGRPYREYR